MENLLPTAKLIDMHFQTQEDGMSLQETVHNRNELREKLAKLIESLLEHDFERLVQGMYRMDVGEEAFKKALSEGTPLDIADLVIERELQKVVLRKKYSS